MQHLTFRSSRIVYYGPHACDNCGVPVAKMGAEFGGNAFTYPEGPIYPNTEWHPHVCDLKRVAANKRLVTFSDGAVDFGPVNLVATPRGTSGTNCIVSCGKLT